VERNNLKHGLPVREDERAFHRARRASEKKRLELEPDQYRHHLEEMVGHRTKQWEAALKRLGRVHDETLQALGRTLGLRDNGTAGHAQRTTRYSLEIAKAMGCTAEYRKEIARGAYLHDVGKIAIPDAILRKPGKLDVQEKAIMETHVRIGYELVSRISFLAEAAQIVLAHQERYDGTGYPQGLMGKEIPLGARIFVVADTLDAMTSDRPYRRALSYSAARGEILRETGRQFDPQVVQAFLNVAEAVWVRIRSEVSGHGFSTDGPPLSSVGLHLPADHVAENPGLSPGRKQH